jgi:hypothetical protein
LSLAAAIAASQSSCPISFSKLMPSGHGLFRPVRFDGALIAQLQTNNIPTSMQCGAAFT